MPRRRGGCGWAAVEMPRSDAPALSPRVSDKPHVVELPNGYVVSDERPRIDMGFVHASLADAYWAEGRPAWLTERSWSNCLCFGVYAPDEKQSGFARVLTDYALRAHVGDVFVHPAARGLGLGKALIAAILGHPELATVTHWTLTTADAHELYARYGFRASKTDADWMTLVRQPWVGDDAGR
ncbi:GNAT family N-acetyltransferase [Aureimonas leprariae]|uniref:GNAT family N-acetyltransferase n=1 Tax=Plantimonas leprariae TaxID=2615207 RepID=A0A7V7U0Q3_9HYPH|nr:GNAT family N-acetyltransferase [Aureimonas leprariae]KAB0680799.1 GNAT family N-acetyltransferase [Aureimonas leprariae]